ARRSRISRTSTAASVRAASDNDNTTTIDTVYLHWLDWRGGVASPVGKDGELCGPTAKMNAHSFTAGFADAADAGSMQPTHFNVTATTRVRGDFGILPRRHRL